jgi:hypothetical protein
MEFTSAELEFLSAWRQQQIPMFFRLINFKLFTRFEA